MTKVLNATLLDPPRMRVVPNRAAAIVLEALLGLILLLSVAAYSTMRLNGILPHNPCSIAGVMSLLAGSRLVDRKTRILSEGAGHLTEKQGEAVQWRFGLGWWNNDGIVDGDGEEGDL